MKRRFLNTVSVITMMLCVVVCVCWVRGQYGMDEVEFRHDRYLADRSAASSQLSVRSDKRLWFTVSRGHVEPFNGQLVWGYYLNADDSGGWPQMQFRHEAYDNMIGSHLFSYNPDSGTSGLGPLRWLIVTRSKATDGDDFRFIQIGVSHWLLALVLLLPPFL